MGYIDPDLAHGANDERIEASRFQPGALHFEAMPRVFLEESLGHLTSGRIVYAKEENFSHVVPPFQGCVNSVKKRLTAYENTMISRLDARSE
jgi:hypothetical protein